MLSGNSDHGAVTDTNFATQQVKLPASCGKRPRHAQIALSENSDHGTVNEANHATQHVKLPASDKACSICLYHFRGLCQNLYLFETEGVEAPGGKPGADRAQSSMPHAGQPMQHAMRDLRKQRSDVYCLTKQPLQPLNPLACKGVAWSDS